MENGNNTKIDRRELASKISEGLVCRVEILERDILFPPMRAMPLIFRAKIYGSSIEKPGESRDKMYGIIEEVLTSKGYCPVSPMPFGIKAYDKKVENTAKRLLVSVDTYSNGTGDVSINELEK